MGNLSTQKSANEPVKSTFSAYLTEDEENALRASFEGHLDIKGALNAPSLALVGDEDLENVDTFLHFVVKLMRKNRTARVTVDAITSQDKARDYFTLLCAWSYPHEQQPEIHEVVGSRYPRIRRACFQVRLGAEGSSNCGLLQQYFPNHTSLLQSYYMAKLGIPQSLSFHPFEPPMFMQQSDIVQSHSLSSIPWPAF